MTKKNLILKEQRKYHIDNLSIYFQVKPCLKEIMSENFHNMMKNHTYRNAEELLSIKRSWFYLANNYRKRKSKIYSFLHPILSDPCAWDRLVEETKHFNVLSDPNQNRIDVTTFMIKD